MPEEEGRYLSYLLRLWQVKSENKLIWHASLESPHTRQRWGFASLAELVDFLQAQTSASANPPDVTEADA